MRPRTILLVAFLTLASAAPARAAMMPSFEADSCAWEATHIVVATEGAKIDGALDVIESWKGDLQPGEHLNVPELAEYEDDAAREIHHGLFGDLELDADGKLVKKSRPKEYVTGARMILFLKKVEKHVAEDRTEIVWKGAAHWGGMHVSIAWVENGKVYGFVQIMNPGGQLLVEVGNENDMKTRVRHLVSVNADFTKAAAVADRGERARALDAFTRSDERLVMFAAFRELVTCGPSALPVLRDIVSSPDRSALHEEAIETLAAAGGEEAGPDLVAIVEGETDYFTQRAPTLAGDWWDKDPDADELKHHYWRAYAAIRGLQKVRYRPCEKAVTRLAEFWRNADHLGKGEGASGSLPRECEDALHALAGENAKPVAPAGENEQDEPAVHTPTLAEIPLTVPDDERRLSELMAKLAEELAAERKLVRERAPLRGKAVDRDLDAELSEAIAKAVPFTGDESWSFVDKVVQHWDRGAAILPLSEDLEALRKKLAPNLERVAAVVTAGRDGSPYDVETGWVELGIGTWTHEDRKYGEVTGLRAAQILHCFHALGVGDAGAAAQGALDLWRFEEDLRREDRGERLSWLDDWRRTASGIALEAVPHLDDRGLAALEGELETLEKTLPSFERRVRRWRLAFGCFLRDTYRGEGKARGALNHLSPQARLKDRRGASLRREWDKFDASARALETASALPLHRAREHFPASAPKKKRPRAETVEYWTDAFGAELDAASIDLGRLRAVRLLAAAQRFRLGKGRWPASVEDAIGHGAGPSELDPFTGRPLEFEHRPDGLIGVTVSSHVGRRGEDVTLMLGPGTK